MPVSKPITLLFPPRGHIYQYSFYPILGSTSAARIRFTQNHEWVLKHDTNDILVLFGWFKYHKQLRDHEWLTQLREKYRTLVYFDDNDGSEILELKFLKYFDLYYKKQLFRDRSLYMNKLYGNRIFADYYHREFGVEEERGGPGASLPDDPEHLKRLRVSWNLAMGQYPLSHIKSILAHIGYKTLGVSALKLLRTRFNHKQVPQAPPIPKCHARFGYGRYRPTVGFQRKLFLETVAGHDEFLSGMVPKKQYNHEIQNVQAVLSPFGWGEVCYRDVEAILNGCVLVKPSMEHLETWPNLFQPNQTYVPVHWNASDLVQTVQELLADPERMSRLRTAAWNELAQAYATCEQRADTVFQEILDA